VKALRGRVTALGRSRGAAIGRREYAEAVLQSRILSMSSLAQRRLARQTDIKNAAAHGFAWPAWGRISQRYGCTGFRLNPPRGSCRHFHDGIDIVSYRGAPIRAAAVGVVTYVGWNPWDEGGRAFMVMLAHPGGYETLYGHLLSSRRVRVGQVVRKGQIIGYMGSTGRSTGTHLHFEVRRGRTTYNPLAFL
jgi:murein DD-endopeptidase MepM/ murein hydrolase activator NlpD